MLTGACAQTPVPQPQGRISDFANVIDESNRELSAQVISDLDERTTSEMAIVTVDSTKGESIEDYAGTVTDSVILGKDIVEVVREIAAAYPHKKKILFGIFGNPDRKDFHLPTDVCVSEVGREVGASYSEVYSFYHNVVVKFFEERFPIEGEKV